MRLRVLGCALLLLLPAPAFAEWQIKPFLGVSFGGETTFIDAVEAARTPNLVVGVSGVLLGDVVGIEADFAHLPGFFQTGEQELILGGSVTTLTGNVIVALPRKLAQYSLRPYVVGGLGLMRASVDQSGPTLSVASSFSTMDVGAGATGFLTDRIGVSWDVRYFRSLGGENRGLSVGEEQVSFWRATMAVAIRSGRSSPVRNLP